MLGFIAGKFDMTYPTDVSVPLLKDIKPQDPEAHCVMRRTNVNTNLIINRDAPPFDNPDIRRALALAIDRKAFNDIMNEGQGRIGGVHAAAARGRLGHAATRSCTPCPATAPTWRKTATKPARIMRRLGYGPDNHAEDEDLHPRHQHVPRSRR